MADLEDEVGGRPGWSFADGIATYRPAATRWRARVREVREPRRGARRYHAAAIDPSDAAHSAFTAMTPEDAVRWSETVIDRFT